MNLSRRKFLKIGAAAAVAVALPSDEFVRKFWQGTDVSAAGRGARCTMTVMDEFSLDGGSFLDWAKALERTDTPLLTMLPQPVPVMQAQVEWGSSDLIFKPPIIQMSGDGEHWVDIPGDASISFSKGALNRIRVPSPMVWSTHAWSMSTAEG